MMTMMMMMMMMMVDLLRVAICDMSTRSRRASAMHMEHMYEKTTKIVSGLESVHPGRHIYFYSTYSIYCSFNNI